MFQMISNIYQQFIVFTFEILNPYYTTKKNGTGLGLSIVNKIINDHRGEIEFYSISDGAKIEIKFIINDKRNTYSR